MRCSGCGTAASDSDVFCGRCGALLQPRSGPDRPRHTLAREQPDPVEPESDERPAAGATLAGRVRSSAPRWLAAATVLVLLAGVAVLVPNVLRERSASSFAALDGERWRTGLGTQPSFRFTNIQPVSRGAISMAAGDDGPIVVRSRTVSAYAAEDGQLRWQRVLPAPEPPTLVGPVVVTPTSRGIVALDRETGDVRWEDPIEGIDEVIAGGPERVYLLRGSDLTAVQASDGAVVWRVQTFPGPATVHVAADEDTIVLSAPEERLVRSLDASSGTVRWEQQLPGRALAPMLEDGNVYLHEEGGAVVALHEDTGEERWRYTAPDGQWGVLEAGAGTVVRWSTVDREAVALAAEDGAPRWSTAAPWPPLQIEHGRLFLPVNQGRVRVVDVRTGDTSWTLAPTAIQDGVPHGSVLYVAGERVITAYDARDGAERWRTATSDPHAPVGFPTPVLDDDRVYVTTIGGPLVALDRGTGGELWRFDPAQVEDELPTDNPAGITSSALPYATHAVAVASNRGVYRLDAASGEVRATFPTNVRAGAVPVWAGGTLVIDTGPSLLGLDPETLRLLWQYTTPTQGAVIGANPVTAATVHGDLVLVGGGDGTLAALDPATGTPAWDLDLGTPITTRPVVDSGVIVLRTDTGDVRAFDAATGRARWRHELSTTGLSDPTVSAGTVYLTDGTELIGLDTRTGTERWRTDPGGGVLSAPTAVGDLAFVGTADGRLVAVSGRSGEVRWRFTADAPVSAPPAVDDDTLVIVTDDSEVVSLR